MPADRDPIREARRKWLEHGWDDAADGMAMVTSVVRVHQLLMERIDAVLRPFELSFARYELLMVLIFSRNGAMPMAKVGTLLQVHPTSVTSAVERLEKQGYVARSRSERDRRVVLATITAEGRSIAQQATEGLNDQVFESVGPDAADVARLTALLDGFRASAGDHVDTV